jgi:signal transduction histidine kinase
MNESSNVHSSNADSFRWTPWRATGGAGSPAGDPWLARLQLYTFRLLAALAVIGLILISFRNIVVSDKGIPIADPANAILFALLLVLSFKNPARIRFLYWVGLLSLSINAIDGMQFAGVVPQSLILVPLLVLYGSLIGDLLVSLAALSGVTIICAYTWFRLEPLAGREMLIFTNVCLLSLFSGVAALSIWLRHHRMAKELALQASALRAELDMRSRLQAIITHDIRNPLMVLLHAAAINDPNTVQKSAKRVAAIVTAASDLATGSALKFSDVTIRDIATQLNEVFSLRMADKEQQVAITTTDTLTLCTDVPILCNSVLSNILSNAIKFSPRGSTITLSAEDTDTYIRLIITDQGEGFPSGILRNGPDYRSYQSRSGTEGERGSGYGLHIAALCAERLGGSLEITNCSQGGAVSVLLPKHMPRPATA